MNELLSALLRQLHADGLLHDAKQSERTRRHRNLEPASAAVLSLLLRIAGARKVVEIGTANGYSTLWLADAVRDTDGQLQSIDCAPCAAAHANLLRAEAVQPGLAERVRLLQQDGGMFLAQLESASIDLLFLDAERVEYARWWPHPLRVLRAGGVLVIDNVLSHPAEVEPLLQLLAAETDGLGVTMPVGKGLHVHWRRC